MVGKAGAGKSSLGNSLLGQPDTKPFKSKKTVNAVTVKCERKRCLLSDGTLLTVIDTPGLFDTSTPNQDTIKELCKCASLSAPGPDIVAVVLSLTRFTREEIDTIYILKKLFGEEAMKHIIIAFTGKDGQDDADDDDDIKTAAEFVQHSPSYLKHVVRECNNRFVSIANRSRSPTHESDVNDVMKLIYATMYENKNQVYSQGIFLKAEKIIQALIGESSKDTTESKSELREKVLKGIESNDEVYLTIL